MGFILSLSGRSTGSTGRWRIALIVSCALSSPLAYATANTSLPAAVRAAWAAHPAVVGLVVDVAEDGQAACALAAQKTYDLILMLDMQMPRLNGLDATRRIRALPGYEETPILGLTANAFPQDRDACLQAGMNTHVAKPIKPQALYGLVLAWLASRPKTPI